MPFDMKDWTPAATIGGGSENVWQDEAGLHVTQTKEGEPIKGGNILATSDGLLIKDGNTIMAAATRNGVKIGRGDGSGIRIGPEDIIFDFAGKPMAKTIFSVNESNRAMLSSDSMEILSKNTLKIMSSKFTGEGLNSASIELSNGANGSSISMRVHAGEIYSGPSHYLDLSSEHGVMIDHKPLDAYVVDAVNYDIWRGFKWSNGYAFIWGRAGVDANAPKPWGSMYYGDIPAKTYPFAWKSQPWEVTSLLRSKNFLLLDNDENTMTETASYYTVCPVQKTATSRCWITYMVAGWWK